jgi:hypothetical protein
VYVLEVFELTDDLFSVWLKDRKQTQRQTQKLADLLTDHPHMTNEQLTKSLGVSWRRLWYLRLRLDEAGFGFLGGIF